MGPKLPASWLGRISSISLPRFEPQSSVSDLSPAFNGFRSRTDTRGKQMRFFVVLLLAVPLAAQHDMSNMPGMQHDSADAAETMEASGTSSNPASSPMNMVRFTAGAWRFMVHGIAFVEDIQQTGPRGGDKFFSTNWFMGEAEHRLGGGTFSVRTMLSLEPATVTDRRYPELFQTGETAYGNPIVDGQHPHDFVMELGLHYSHPLGEKTSWELYAAPVGDPALGPVAFPHRISAEELPEAPLGHHLQDSTHIADEVVTAALRRPHWGAEISGFHGAEPGENRWIIQTGGLDSWSARLSWTPTINWSAQISAGSLHKPEALEPGNQLRSTASVTYNRPYTKGDWATSVIWGRNHETDTKRNLNSYLLESVARFWEKNYITGRAELVDRDELFADQPLI